MTVKPPSSTTRRHIVIDASAFGLCRFHNWSSFSISKDIRSCRGLCCCCSSWIDRRQFSRDRCRAFVRRSSRRDRGCNLRRILHDYGHGICVVMYGGGDGDSPWRAAIGTSPREEVGQQATVILSHRQHVRKSVRVG